MAMLHFITANTDKHSNRQIDRVETSINVEHKKTKIQPTAEKKSNDVTQNYKFDWKE